MPLTNTLLNFQMFRLFVLRGADTGIFFVASKLVYSSENSGAPDEMTTLLTLSTLLTLWTLFALEPPPGPEAG